MPSPSSFSVRLRQGLDEVLERQANTLPGLAEETAFTLVSVREQVRRVRVHADSQADEDRVLAAAIRRYRRQPASGWSAVLLDLMAPTLVYLSQRVRSLPSGVERSDVEQQAVLEALKTAATLRLPHPPRWVRRQLEIRIGDGLVRWLAAGEPERRLEHGRVATSGVSADDLGLLYRMLVLGQSSAEIGRVLGVSARTARRRLRAARLRVASSLTSGSVARAA